MHRINDDFKAYTVVLSYPDYIATDGPEYHTVMVEATSVRSAIRRAQEVASATACAERDGDFCCEADDFALVVVMEGACSIVAQAPHY